MNKLKVYCASGWFTPNQVDAYEKIHLVLDEFKDELDIFYPKEEFQFQSGTVASDEDRKRVFDNNINAIDSCDFMICSTEDKDLGSIMEAGMAFAKNKPIIYICLSLGDRPLNLMLAQSGIAAITDIKDLRLLLDIITAEGLDSEHIKACSFKDKIE